MADNQTKTRKTFKQLLTAGKPGGVILRILILIAIPYAYLMLCGLIFDWWLHAYNMTNFVFYSLVVLAAAALVLMVCSIVWYVQSQKNNK